MTTLDFSFVIPAEAGIQLLRMSGQRYEYGRRLDPGFRREDESKTNHQSPITNHGAPCLS